MPRRTIIDSDEMGEEMEEQVHKAVNCLVSIYEAGQASKLGTRCELHVNPNGKKGKHYVIRVAEVED